MGWQQSSTLLRQIKEPIASFTGNKGYDQSTVYNHILHHTRDAQTIIHPRFNAVVSNKKENGKIEAIMSKRY